MRTQTCRLHPNAAPFVRTCSGCAQDCHDAQYGNSAREARKAAALADKVRKALGRYIAPNVRPQEGETPTRRMVWSLHEMTDLWNLHADAKLTDRPVVCAFEGGEYPATEITLTITLPTIGTVEVFTTYTEDDYPNGVPDIAYFTEKTPAAV